MMFSEEKPSLQSHQRIFTCTSQDFIQNTGYMKPFTIELLDANF